MKSGSRLRREMNYQSTAIHISQTCPGVQFAVRRLSLAGRMELLEKIREAGTRLEFHQAGSSVEDTASSAAIHARVDELYVRWGLHSIEGLSIDGQPATADSLLAKGPNGLAVEIAMAVRREIFLDEEERKN